MRKKKVRTPNKTYEKALYPTWYRAKGREPGIEPAKTSSCGGSAAYLPQEVEARKHDALTPGESAPTKHFTEMPGHPKHFSFPLPVGVRKYTFCA